MNGASVPAINIYNALNKQNENIEMIAFLREQRSLFAILLLAFGLFAAVATDPNRPAARGVAAVGVAP